MKPWTWFETQMYGSTRRKLSGAQKLKLLTITVVLGVTLGIVLVTSGAAGLFITAGMQQAGIDPRSLYGISANPTTVTSAGQASVPVTATLTTAPLRGGWVNQQP
jgi:hypothetical protein